MTSPPTQSAAVYLTRRGYFIHAKVRTDAGIWIASLPAYLVPLDAVADVLGRSVVDALRGSGGIVASPQRGQFRAKTSAVLSVAGVSSWDTLQREAALCTLWAERTALAVEPTRNGGRSGDARGYCPLEEKRQVISSDASPTLIANAVIESLGKCQ